MSGPAVAGVAPLIALQAATVRLGDVTALQDVSFTLGAGERVALVGSNGSGKSTLLRLLHGQLRCDAGRRVAARDGQAREPSQAMVFQRPFLLRVSVWSNLLLALWLAGVPRAERAVRAHLALQRVGLADHAARAARVLSGGQQQRLALARAWAVRPQVLFLDEPTASLDPGAKHEVEALIDAFADEGMTVVMSTHNLGQARRLARRVLYLEAGRVVVDRPVDAFFDTPLPDRAAQFLRGEVPWRSPH
ncbi:MAG: ATP-binding cassette domain-containing protein [Aquabacterium sp.]